MKILIATFTYLPEDNGVSHVAHSHATGFVQKGHEVTVITAINKERNLKQMEKEGIRVVQFDVKGSGNIRQGYFGEIKKYQEFIANFNADVMLFHCWQVWSTNLAIPVFSFNKAKKILVSHGVSANSILSPRNVVSWLCWRPYLWKMPSMLSAFDHMVFLSARKDKDRFYDYYLTQKMGLINYSIIPNGTYPINQHKSKIDFKEKYKINSSYMILQVANYEFRKNQKMALKAFLKSGVEDTTMLFMGSQKNDYSNQLEKLIKRSGMENKVRILEKISREDITAAHLAADIFLNSSLWEAQPLVILDAMSAGVPFISTDVGCISDMPGGIIIKNEFDMADKIKKLIIDENLRRSLGEEGRKACNTTYSWSNTIDAYDSLLKKLTMNLHPMSKA